MTIRNMRQYTIYLINGTHVYAVCQFSIILKISSTMRIIDYNLFNKRLKDLKWGISARMWEERLFSERRRGKVTVENISIFYIQTLSALRHTSRNEDLEGRKKSVNIINSWRGLSHSHGGYKIKINYFKFSYGSNRSKYCFTIFKYF